MDTRILYLAAVIIASISGAYYYYSGKGQKLETQNSSNMVYSADGLDVLQTNEQGDLYIRAEIEHLEQNLQNDTSKLRKIDATMYLNNQVDATFKANTAAGFNQNEKIILSGDVKATKVLQTGQMIFTTDQLTLFPKQRQLETQQRINITSPGSQFVSQGLKADFNSGQYDFFNIRGEYVP
ncbi:LPS export ABC transporter periplasmic protein LptC [Acinetobacter larvae]|uniref:LPS export ABC transporter periplasmic protein LptC n=1 Tax=Acinetobacter larvae TaxID=1789224 RepID=A0A1B2LY98_9GAMM|nr:LPS export ABC transporter periplasmic protein LptC [Acinetobacter larvae]AOA57906.1 LPS export ABC transporter periplasmic protein LptC [Acinetobacter larvae]